MGSWLAITDNSGSLKNHYNYDAWGRRRDPVTWKLCPINPASASIGGSNAGHAAKVRQGIYRT